MTQKNAEIYDAIADGFEDEGDVGIGRDMP